MSLPCPCHFVSHPFHYVNCLCHFVSRSCHFVNRSCHFVNRPYHFVSHSCPCHFVSFPCHYVSRSCPCHWMSFLNVSPSYLMMILLIPYQIHQILLFGYQTTHVLMKIVDQIVSHILVVETSEKWFGNRHYPIGIRIVVMDQNGSHCPIVNFLIFQIDHNWKNHVHFVILIEIGHNYFEMIDHNLIDLRVVHYLVHHLIDFVHFG